MRLPAAMRSLIWPFIEAGTAVVAGAVAVLVIARLIGAEAFGSGSIALGIVLITQVIINSLVHDALIRSEQLPSEDVDVAFTATLIAAAIMGLLVAAMAPFVGLLLRHPHIAVYIWAFIPILFLGGLPVTLIAERRRALDFNTVAIHQIIGRFVGTALGLSAAWYGAGVWSLVIQYTCTGGYTAIAMYALAARYPRFRFSWTRLKPMLGFCSPIIGSQLGVHATTWLFLFAMGRFHGLVSAGHWSVATRIADSLFRGVMQAAYHVALARLALHQLARDRLRSALIKGQTLSGLAAIPLLVALAAAAEPVVQLLLGSSWAPAGRLAIGPLV